MKGQDGRGHVTQKIRTSLPVNNMRKLHSRDTVLSELPGSREEVNSSQLTTGHSNRVSAGHDSRNLRSLSVCTDERIKILKDWSVP